MDRRFDYMLRQGLAHPVFINMILLEKSRFHPIMYLLPMVVFLTPTAELVAGTRHITCPRRSKTFPVRPPAESLQTPGLTSSSEGDSSDRAPASAPVLCQVTTETGWRLRLQSQKIATRQVKQEALAFKLAERAMIEKYSTAAGLKGPFSGDDSQRSNNLYMRSP